jgi:hypothetical protein
MTFTVVYISDDLSPSCYGQFSTREAATKVAERMERDLDDDRDDSGGGVGWVHVCKLQRRSDW